MKRFSACGIIFMIGLLIQGCNEGISPVEEQTITEAHGIKGTIHFTNWPPSDSIVDLRLVAFLNYPPIDIYTEVLQGRAKYSEKLLTAVDSLSYTLILNPLPADTIRCIAIGQQFGPNIQTDWILVGVYYIPGDSSAPGKVFIPSDSIVANINISVNFQKLPPQP
jgi:hypothetical protein